MVLFPFTAKPLNTFMPYCRLLWMTGIHVLSTKLMPHSPKQDRRRNMVCATKQRGITSRRRLYEKRFGNRSFQKSHTQVW